MTKPIIPIYRAKRLNSDEYVEGLYFNDAEGHWIVDEYTMSIDEECEKIDITTLAIHFDGMVDSNGKKIFASLSEEGKGGTVVKVNHSFKIKDHICKYESGRIVLEIVETVGKYYGVGRTMKESKVISIKD